MKTKYFVQSTNPLPLIANKRRIERVGATDLQFVVKLSTRWRANRFPTAWF